MLTDDEHIQTLNGVYRQADRPTDVLAFSQLEGEPVSSESEIVALGDIVISVETAKRQAAERGYTLDEELELLVVHGALHLLSYDDETEAGAAEMREHEKVALDKLKDGRRD